MRGFVIGVVVLLAAAAPLAAQQQPGTSEGEQIFQLVCAMCHSVNPPAKVAPPMSHASAYYVRRYENADSAVAALVRFLKEPSAERSAMPAMAVERFGLMPSQGHLSDAQLAAAARYVLQLADTAHVRHRPHP